MKLSKIGKEEKEMEMRGVEPRTFHMRSERSTTELHPPHCFKFNFFPIQNRKRA